MIATIVTVAENLRDVNGDHVAVDDHGGTPRAERGAPWQEVSVAEEVRVVAFFGSYF